MSLQFFKGRIVTCFSLIKVTTASVLVGSLGACGLPFLFVLPVPPVDTVSVQPVAVADPTAADLAEQERRELRQERNQRIQDRRERNNRQDDSASVSRAQDDAEDDRGRDCCQIASPVFD